MTDGTDAPAVSVVICVRNGEATLVAQLDALAAQEGAPPFEILVVDNGSTDRTVDVTNAWIRSGTGAASRARVVDGSARVGICHARNTGARAADGRWLAFCDADDVVATTWLAGAADGLGAGCDAVTGRVYALEDGNGWERIVLDEPGRIVTPSRSIPFAWGCSFAVTKDAFVRAGGFDESLPPYGCDDIDFGLRLARAGLELGYRPRMSVSYRDTPGVRRTIRKHFRSGVAQACIWMRHPEAYGPLPGLAQLTHGIVRDPLRTLVRGSGPIRRRALVGIGDFSRRLGAIVGLRRWVLSGRLGEARPFEDTAASA